MAKLPQSPSRSVFISHAHESREYRGLIQQLADQLQKAGVDIWLDASGTRPSEAAVEATSRRLEEADYVVLVWTPLVRRSFRNLLWLDEGSVDRDQGRIPSEALVLRSFIRKGEPSRRDLTRLIPVVFSPQDASSLPQRLQPLGCFDLSSENGYESFLKLLIGNPLLQDASAGHPRVKPPPVDPEPMAERAPLERVPPRNLFFTGREELLEDLERALGKGFGAVVLTGLPGTGKTAVAIEYAHRHRESYSSVFWLSADAPGCEAARSWLQTQKNWLLVLDGAHQPADLRKVLPRGAAGHVIVTSRRTAWGRYSSPWLLWSPVTTLPVGPLTTHEAMSLLLHRSRRETLEPGERAAVLALVESLGGLPATVQRMADWIGQDRMRSEKELARLLSLFGSRLPGPPEGNLGMGAIRRSYAALDPASSVDATVREILGRLACLDLSSKVPAVLLRARESPVIEKALHRLQSLGWLAGRDLLRVHPVVAAFVAAEIDPSPARAAVEEVLVRRAGQLIAAEDWEEAFLWRPHLERAAETARTREDDRAAELCHDLGCLLLQQRELDLAQLYLERAQVIGESLHQGQPALADTLATLAALHRTRGQMGQALPLLARSLAIRKAAFGENHPLVESTHSLLETLRSDRNVLREVLLNEIEWGHSLLHQLEEDGAQIKGLQQFAASRWLVRVRLPEALQETYGIAPESLLLVVRDEMRGGDLQRAQNELHARDLDLDPDLLVVVDGRPKLAERLGRLPQLWGQWVPWCPSESGFPPLVSELRRHLPAYDVFEQRDPVRGRQVIGRSEMISDLLRRVLQGQAVGLFGLRKVGKTTLVRAVTDRLDQLSARLSRALPGEPEPGGDHPRTLVVWLDVERVFERTLESVASRLSRELERRCGLARVSLPAPGGDALAHLDAALATALSQINLPLCIVLDEYDLLFEGAGGEPAISGIHQLFQCLRGHAQQTGRLSLVVIGRDPDFLQRPLMGGWPNPMLGWVVARWLGPLASSSADELLRQLGRRVLLDVGDTTAALARRWTGGHPLLHRQFGSALLELAQARGPRSHSAPTDELVEEAVDLFLERHTVIEICREVDTLLEERYPDAARLLSNLCRASEESCDLPRARDRPPGARVLRSFGLLQGERHYLWVPQVFRWYRGIVSPHGERHSA